MDGRFLVPGDVSLFDDTSSSVDTAMQPQWFRSIFSLRTSIELSKVFCVCFTDYLLKAKFPTSSLIYLRVPQSLQTCYLNIISIKIHQNYFSISPH